MMFWGPSIAGSGQENNTHSSICSRHLLSWYTTCSRNRGRGTYWLSARGGRVVVVVVRRAGERKRRRSMAWCHARYGIWHAWGMAFLVRYYHNTILILLIIIRYIYLSVCVSSSSCLLVGGINSSSLCSLSFWSCRSSSALVRRLLQEEAAWCGE